MKRTSVLDFLGVARVAGYALALVAMLIALALFLLSHAWPLLRFGVIPAMAGPILAGLVVAWVAGLSRVLVRRMHFASLQD